MPDRQQGSRFPGRVAAAIVLCLLGAEHAAAQEVARWGRLTVAGEVAASVSPEDPAFFNDSGYRGNALRTLSMGLDASLRVARPVALLTQIRADDFSHPTVYALYLRLRPWENRSFDVQIGRIPPVFGAYLRRPYSSGNPLIGRPLAYQYLTTLRPDTLPGNADDLLRVRGRGWSVRYPSGVPAGVDRAPGLPLIQGLRWDTGIEATVGTRPVQLAMALTQGSLCNPQLDDDNDGKAVSARLAWTPAAGLIVGGSAARGAYTTREVEALLPPGAGTSFAQQSVGVDLEYSRDHGIARLEWMASDWDVPVLGSPALGGPLRTWALSVEGAYRLAPGWDVAVRVDTLRPSVIQGTDRRAPWDSPVSRVETGMAYRIRRSWTVKAVYQHNWRGDGPPGRRGFPAAQVLWRF